MTVQTFYHYTSEAGKNGIESSKKIKKSAEGIHGRHGEGVYFTTITPNTTKKEIAKNNYDSRGRYINMIHKVKY